MILQLLIDNASFNIYPPPWRIVDGLSTMCKIDKASFNFDPPSHDILSITLKFLQQNVSILQLLNEWFSNY